jgi:hypothetical protein
MLKRIIARRKKAVDLYWKRFHGGDASVAVVGVNDYLQQNGLLK